LKRANVPQKELLKIYCSCIRPTLEYCSPVFHHSLSGYLSDDLENIQKRALSIINPGVSYPESLEQANLKMLSERRADTCQKLFDSITNNPSSHKLYHLLPPRHTPKYNLRRTRSFNVQKARTNRFKNTFISAMSAKC
jgi:hypothetical protein